MALLDWRHVYEEIFPTILAGGFLNRLRTETASIVLTTGCQRSGTTWLTKILGSGLRNAHAPKELEVCNYLIDNFDIFSAGVGTLILQTTFVNTEFESYATLSDEIPVIAIARNPLSVCWSMVNNWNYLPLEYARRCRTTYNPRRVHNEEELWSMAMHLYRQSAEATMAISSDRPNRTRLLIYDELILDLPAALRSISVFLGREVAAPPPALRVDLRPACKHTSMPTRYRQLIERECGPIFDRMKGFRVPPNP